MRVAMLLLHLPQALHTALQVAAPQQDAAKVARVPMDGIARRGRDSSAPMVVVPVVVVVVWLEMLEEAC